MFFARSLIKGESAVNVFNILQWDHSQNNSPLNENDAPSSSVCVSFFLLSRFKNKKNHKLCKSVCNRCLCLFCCKNNSLLKMHNVFRMFLFHPFRVIFFYFKPNAVLKIIHNDDIPQFNTNRTWKFIMNLMMIRTPFIIYN